MKRLSLVPCHCPPCRFPTQLQLTYKRKCSVVKRRSGHKRLNVAVCSAEILTSIYTMQELPQHAGCMVDNQNKKHLVVMANGLFGKASNWDVVIDNLQKVLDTSQTLLVASDANSLMQTFDGIDSCGDRLAAEVLQKAKEYPSLEKISLLGHSMGGLLVRYAAGKLYDPVTCLICGLVPAHFITLATPHMGCDGEGPAQVPFIGWTGGVPVAGHSMQRLLQSVAKPFVATFMKRTGQQFFMHDTDEDQQPLLVRMSQDSAENGYFLAALNSFVTRTCYANAGGDHLVGWANSSIRHPDELPVISPETRLRGVIREDPLQAALHPQHAEAFSKHAADRNTGGSEHGIVQSPAEEQQSLADASQAGSTQHQCSSGADAAPETQSQSQSQQQQKQQKAGSTVSSSANALLVLRRLQSLPWRRIDVSFQHSSMPFFAHNHIQVTRKWLNWEGAPVCQHLAQQLADMEKDEFIQQIMGTS